MWLISVQLHLSRHIKYRAHQVIATMETIKLGLFFCIWYYHIVHQYWTVFESLYEVFCALSYKSYQHGGDGTHQSTRAPS